MDSASSQPAYPALPLESGAKPPWRPRVAGIVGFLFGPVAAALITFINLRRLGERRKAMWTLILTVLICVAFGAAIAMVPDNVTTMLGKFIGNVLSPFLYPLLQQRAFHEWEKNHLGSPYDSGWRSIGWAILGIAAFLVITIGSEVAISGNDEARDIEVHYTMPKKISVNETFVFTIRVQNTANYPQLLHSLDIDTRFLEGISILQTSPAFKKSESNLLAPIRSYTFNQTIPPKGSVEIELQARGQKAGRFPLEVDVCVKTAFTCSTFELDTTTVE